MTRTHSNDPTDIDQLFRVLGDARRRRILVRLRDADPGAEFDASPEELGLGDGSRDELEISLVHVHLPKLARAGLIVWDREEGTVRRGPRFGSVEPVIDLLEEFERTGAPGQREA